MPVSYDPQTDYGSSELSKNLLFLKANSSSDCFLSGLRFGRSFFTLLGLLLRSCRCRRVWGKEQAIRISVIRMYTYSAAVLETVTWSAWICFLSGWENHIVFACGNKSDMINQFTKAKQLLANYTSKQCYSLPCSRGLLRAGVEALAAGSSGSRVWGCWAAPGGPTSWCWRGRYCGRRGEAGCGRWAPPSWPSPQRAERGWGGETGAEMRKRSRWWDGDKPASEIQSVILLQGKLQPEEWAS